METNQYLYRSQLNDSFIVAFLCGTVFFIWFYHLPPFGIPVWLLVLIGALFNYIVLAIFQSRYYFYEDQFIRIFTFRPFYRKNVFKYGKTKVRYIHAAGMGGHPQFVIFNQHYRKYSLSNFFNTFLFKKSAKRVEIVEFLLSKNVKMEVRTDFEKKDKEIIDRVKKKYPQNIRLYP